MPDIQPFVSPVDGSVISSRSAWREHDKRHGVTNASDFTNQWAQQAKEREKVFQGLNDKQARKQAVIDAFNKLENRRRP
jgi:hypothetical protein